MSDHDTPAKSLPWDVIIHSTAGILCLLVGGIMVLELYPWATTVFSALMLITFVSAVAISASTNSWVRGHFLAMTPILGVGLGYSGVDWGFLLAYGLLWLAFIHFVSRGFVQS
jgi:hypothetical protein